MGPLLATCAVIIAAAFVTLLPLFLFFVVGERLLALVPFGRGARFLLVMVKNLRRNSLRTVLTYVATFVLVLIVTLVWSTLHYLDQLTSEKAKDLKLIISEKWQANSQMPFAYAGGLSAGAADPSRRGDVRPKDSMTWQFYVGTLDAEKKTRDNLLFFIAMEPRKILTIMDNVFDDFTPGLGRQRGERRLEQVEKLKEAVARMENDKRGVLLGQAQLEAIHKHVGDRIQVTGTNYTGIDLEFEILGTFPRGRYDRSAVMNRDYLNDALETYPRTHGKAPHPLADKSLNLVWLQVADLQEFRRVAEQIEASGQFQSPPVKCETLSSGIASWLAAYSDLIWGLRWLVSPAILITMALILSTAVSISVQERRTEMAVLKVLGFRPAQVLLLVLGEGMLLGALGGAVSAGFTFVVVNRFLPTSAEFPLVIPDGALWWGPAAGAAAALVGSGLPALAACRVRVSQVFARVT